MKELTDEIVQKSLDSFNSTWIIILVILLVFTVIFIGVMISLKRQTKVEQDKKRFRNLKNNIIGLLIATITLALLELGGIFMIKNSYENKENWRIEIHTITSLSHHTEYENDSDVEYEVYEAKVGEYSKKIKISEDEYNTLKEGDKVYVLIAGKSLAVDLWNTKEYKYVGEKLK
ncbi:MAG: hypothetical protein J6J36_01055 [Clostridia bacterium]|nr:hypothetical protein [Clostridia bacterium]